ncbi:MAG: hypothetical protein IKE58_06340 [Blautia sp.]|nr:hypothetical protein [Blautia sp.]
MNVQTKDIPTRAANREIENIRDEDDLKKTIMIGHDYVDTIFVRDAARFMELTGITRQKMAIIVAPVMSSGHLYSLLNGNRKPNKREHVIAIGLALGLSVDDMTILLKDSGDRGLDTRRSIGDTVVIYGISNKLSLIDINDMLHEVGADYVLFD